MADDAQELIVNFVGDQLVFGKPKGEGNQDGQDESEDDVEENERDDDDDSSNSTEENMDEEEEGDGEVLEEDVVLDMHGFEGPTTWEEVERSDLDRVMVSVTSAAMPSTDNKELASRLAMQAAAHEAENSDPLGLGIIDTRKISLMRLDSAARRVHRVGRIVGDVRRRSTSRRYGQDGVARQSTGMISNKEPLINASNIQEMRSKALPYSEEFDAEVYLGAFHSNTSLTDLVKGRSNLKNEVSERTGQLKALVKENFDRFISCKNTIDDIHKRLRKSEAHDGVSASGNSTADLVIAISEVHEEAKKAFATLLDRAATSDQVKSVVLLLKRYESMFQLPSRIRQSIDRGECDQAISEYRKARSLMDSMGAHTAGVPKSNNIWHRLFSEAEQVIVSLVEQLRLVLSDKSTPQLEALDAMRYVLQLQADRVSSALDMDPIQLYTRARETHMIEVIETCTGKYSASLSGLSACDPQRNYMGANSQEVRSVLRESLSSSLQLDCTAAIWTAYVKELTETIAQQLPDFWHAPQDKLNQIKAVPGALTKLTEGVELGLQIAQDTLNGTMDKLKLAFQALVKEEKNDFFLSALRDSISLFVSFRTTSTPPFVTAGLQSLLRTATSLTVEQMITRTKDLTGGLHRHEDFDIVPSSHKAGHPASRAPGMLREVVASSMTQLESVMQEAERADNDLHSFNPIGDSGSTLRRAFFDSFSTYAVAIGQLWSSIAGNPYPHTGEELSKDLKLLVLHSNCVHTRTHVLKELSNRYGELLSMNEGADETRQLLAETSEDIKAVEGRLAKTYIEARVELLNNMLDEYFDEDGTEWSQTPLPSSLRDSTYEVINTLVSVQAELYGNALSLQRRVMDELLGHLFSAYNTFLSDRLNECSVGGILQLLLELQYLGQALRPILRPPRNQLLDQALASVLEKIDQLAEEEADPANLELDDWCETVQGGNMGGRAELVAKFKTKDMINATRFNVASFKA